MPLSTDSVQGVTHEGAPKGNWEVINGVNSYVALPTGEYSSDVAIILLSDVFGVQLINTRLLADDFAKNGFQTYIPDYLNNDPMPVNGLSRGSSFDTVAWLRKHGKEATRGTLDEFILGLSERGVLVFGAVGYSFGARYVFDLAFDNVITAAVVNHPSLLYIPDDLEKYASYATAPLLVNSCTYDEMFPPMASAMTDAVLGDGKFAPGYKRLHFDGCSHGFAVRANAKDPQMRTAKDASFVAAVRWFRDHLLSYEEDIVPSKL